MLLEAPDYFYERKPSRITWAICSNCGYPIYEGDDYYKVDGRDYCKECIEDCRTFAEG